MSLIVDDEAIHREKLQTLLRENCPEVSVRGFAKSTDEARKILSNLKVDIVFLDIDMPELNGLDATRQIRELEARAGSSRVPILALTANARKEDIAECRAAGMDGHLSKPFDRQDLDESIAKLVSSRRAA